MARFIPARSRASFAAWTPGSLAPASPRSGCWLTARRRRSKSQELHCRPRRCRAPGRLPGRLPRRAGRAGELQAELRAADDRADGRADAELRGEMDALKQQMADTVADAAVSLARQVVRGELRCQPPRQVAGGGAGGIEALLLSARHVTRARAPDDQPLVAEGRRRDAGSARRAPGGRCRVTRGGCLVESDIGHRRSIGRAGGAAAWVGSKRRGRRRAWTP